MFTTEPSINAMLDPRIVAASVRRLRCWDRPEGNTGIARMMPASQGGRVKPTIGTSNGPRIRNPADSSGRQRGLDLPDHVGLTQRAFQRVAIPFGGIGG